ncbi:conserved hypothetical protein [gamma proteobacterium HTCC5015]|nr:conserved hypothetical protein [gamma proteobacterium HTCC5015]
MFRTVRCFIAVIFLTATSSIIADDLTHEHIRIVAPTTPLWAKENGLGIAPELFSKLQESLPEWTDIEIATLPLNRAIASYAIHHSDCFIGGDVTLFRHLYPGALIASRPIKQSSILLLTLQSKPIINQLSALEGLSVGIPEGTHRLAIDLLEKHGASTVKARNFPRLKKLIELGRIDAIAGPDLTAWALPKLHYDERFKLIRYQDTLHCHDNKTNRALIKSIDPALEALKKAGYIGRLLERHTAAAHVSQ